MKKFIILLLVIILVSCQNNYLAPKENYPVRKRIYNSEYDTVVRKIVEFIAESETPFKSIVYVPGLIMLDENLNSSQAYKYSDYTPETKSHLINCNEKLLIYVNSDSGKTSVEIKSVLNCKISYLKTMLKYSETVEKNITNSSTGIREKEILDYLSEKL